MGKVGSSSIKKALQDQKLPVFHIHYLTEEKIKHVRTGKSFPKRPFYAKHYWESKYLLRYIKNNKKQNSRWKVITLVRDPIARNISGFFQVIRWLIPDFERRYKKGLIKFEILRELFLSRYEHNTVLEWLDLEIKRVLCINVYKNAFPILKGFQIYRSPKADLLLLRVENMQQCAQSALQNFLGINHLDIQPTNQAVKKGYANAYSEFLSRISLPNWYIDHMYTSKYAKHFYSRLELQEFRIKWQHMLFT